MTIRSIVLMGLLLASRPLTAQQLVGATVSPGDCIILTVAGVKELSDTFVVDGHTELALPQVGLVSLAGVRRSDLQRHFTTALARYIRDPEVTTELLLRLSIEGEVSRPGIYTVAPQAPLSELVSVAGGLTRDANLDKSRLERGETTLLSGRVLGNAVRTGRTLDALDLRAGDRVIIARHANLERTARIVGILTSIPIAIFTLVQIF